MTTQGHVKILFVCMGNICRSPMAEGYLRHRVSDIPALDVLIDSAGTHSYHAGAEPDKRAQKAAQQRGVDISMQAARPVTAADF
ncbi:MAG: low molecular weight phosphotyrosine protein phosphatase, partial [Gammaproteobacteria bacterium]|nr:low molecular weight phosphotyrosine protein phosphatase [Gammaproteobacteria bacterium]